MRASFGQVVVDGLSHGEAELPQEPENPWSTAIEMISEPEPVAAIWA